MTLPRLGFENSILLKPGLNWKLVAKPRPDLRVEGLEGTKGRIANLNQRGGR